MLERSKIGFMNFGYANPIPTDCKLDEDGEEEEDGLVGGGEVDPTVEADQEDQLDQQGGVDNGVGETRAKPEEEGEQTIKMLQQHDHSARDVTGMKVVQESQQPQQKNLMRAQEV